MSERAAVDVNVPDPTQPCVPLPRYVLVRCPSCEGPARCSTCEGARVVRVLADLAHDESVPIYDPRRSP